MNDCQVVEIALLADEYHHLASKGMGTKASVVKEYMERLKKAFPDASMDELFFSKN